MSIWRTRVGVRLKAPWIRDHPETSDGRADWSRSRNPATNLSPAMAGPWIWRAALPWRTVVRNRCTLDAAAVARAATRRMMLSEVSPQERASAFLGLGIVGNEPEPALTLVTEGLELRHEIANASCKAHPRDDDSDAAVLIPRNEPRLLEIRQQHLTNARWHARRVGERVCGWGALFARPSGERVLEPLQMPDARTA